MFEFDDKVSDAINRIAKDGKYHICTELEFDFKTSQTMVKSWKVFLKLEDFEEYMSPKNKPILSSEYLDRIDLIKFSNNLDRKD